MGGKKYVTKNISLYIRRLHGPRLTMIIPDICYILPTRIHKYVLYLPYIEMLYFCHTFNIAEATKIRRCLFVYAYSHC